MHFSGEIRPFFRKKFWVNLAGGLENLDSVPTIASDLRIKKTTCFKKTIEEEKKTIFKKGTLVKISFAIRTVIKLKKDKNAYYATDADQSTKVHL